MNARATLTALKSRLVCETRAGETLPYPWLGVAWFTFERDVAVCMIVPLNRIARWLRSTWLSLRFPRGRDYVERSVESALHASQCQWLTIMEGVELRGYQRGVREGQQKLKESIIAELNAQREQVRALRGQVPACPDRATDVAIRDAETITPESPNA